MKKRYLITLLTVFIYASSISQSINYIRITEGLGVPAFEKGRTIFAFDDLNDDGHLDIISIGDHGNPFFNSPQHGLLIWFNQGNNTFENYMIGNFGYGGIAVGDVNNDGFKDVGYGMHHNYSNVSFGDQLIEVALGDGTGLNWTPWDTGLATNGESWGMFGTDLADVNNNGLLDLVSISFGGGDGLHVYLNQGDGTWVQSFGFLGNNSDDLVHYCDINNDGYIDIIASHAEGTAYFGDGTGNFQKNDNGLPTIGQYSTRNGIAVGDINNNGGYGLAYVNPSGGILVYEWDNALNTWIDYSGNLPASGSYRLVQLWDMNADGFTDVMAFGDRFFQLWLGDGNGNWTEDAAFQTLKAPGTAKAFTAGGDLNKTGIGDILILADETGGMTNKNIFYVYVDDTEPDSLWIRPLYPKGKECFYPGSIRFIKWASAVPNGGYSVVKIEISAFGNEGPWWIMADNLPNNGKYQWTVPDYGSTDCYLKLTVSNGFNSENSFITNEAFTIFGDPTSDKNMSKDESCYIYPNPGKDILHIFSTKNEFAFILKDITGNKVLQIHDQKTIKTKELPVGIYFYEIQEINGNKTTGKWIKM